MAFEPDAIIHLAAETHVDRSITDPSTFLTTNIMGTYRLLEGAVRYYDKLPSARREQFRFVHVSTDEVYGTLGATGKFREDTPYAPTSPYSASKAAADHIALAWYKTYGLPVIVSNCSNNYGPRQFPEKLIPLAILNALERMPLRVYGDGSNVRDWLYVEDHALGLLAIAERGTPGEKYNLGGDNERTNLSVVQRICDALDLVAPCETSYRSLITFVEDRPGHDFRYAIDGNKARSELGWSPCGSFEDWLEHTVRWYVENDAWWRPLRQGYQGGRLGIRASKST
jgi:dTDP-glucose 4,6-dehydratase